MVVVVVVVTAAASLLIVCRAVSEPIELADALDIEEIGKEDDDDDDDEEEGDEDELAFIVGVVVIGEF